MLYSVSASWKRIPKRYIIDTGYFTCHSIYLKSLLTKSLNMHPNVILDIKNYNYEHSAVWERVEETRSVEGNKRRGNCSMSALQIAFESTVW